MICVDIQLPGKIIEDALFSYGVWWYPLEVGFDFIDRGIHPVVGIDVVPFKTRADHELHDVVRAVNGSYPFGAVCPNGFVGVFRDALFRDHGTSDSYVDRRATRCPVAS